MDARITVIQRMKADLRAAMKARNSVRVATLRMMLSALDNASAVEVDTHYAPVAGVTPDVPRKELSEQAQLDVLCAEAAARRVAVAQYEQLGQGEVVARLRAELDVFAEYIGNDAQAQQALK